MNAIWDKARSAFSERLTRNWSPHALPSRATAPVVSFSFDDFPRSAAREGASVLREFGVKGTYFVAGARSGRHLDDVDQFTKDDLLAVADAGHEIGCHTFGHIRLPTASLAEITDDLLRNQEFVQQILGDYTMCSFAYPDGDVSIATKALVGRWFPICRGIWGGVNHRRIDFMQLKAVSARTRFRSRACREDPRRRERDQRLGDLLHPRRLRQTQSVWMPAQPARRRAASGGRSRDRNPAGQERGGEDALSLRAL